ncbi:MAG TPA: hypothetical protein VMH87_02785 [Pseudomonadales bacterium]|nr:hypothetical protein [Pseudomonadales bacterium]
MPLLFVMAAFAVNANVLFDDFTNYPYNNGPIEGQGPWYTTSTNSATSLPADDIMVTNNVILLNATNYDYPQAPTNGWKIPPVYDNYTYASFRLMVTQLSPFNTTSNGDIVCELINTNAYSGNTNGASACHLFIDQIGTTLPGTYHLGIANFQTEFAGLGYLAPPHNHPMDLATDVWYTVVLAYDNSGDDLQGATLWINPSLNDYTNWYDGLNIVSPGVATDYAYGNDYNGSEQQESIIPQDIRFEASTYAGNFGISNVLIATDDNGDEYSGTGFKEVLSTNPPVIGVQPQSGADYSGNPATFATLASGVDVTYQWYSTTYGALSDGSAYTGSQSNILTVNSLSASDTYYCKVTDIYGNEISSSNAVETVNTTPTAPFFQGEIAVTNTQPLFTSATFSNPAQGTGPLTYQWYFATTNLTHNPTVYTALSGQTSPTLNLNLEDLTYQGTYYVVATGADGVTYGPTNTLVESQAVFATLLQLHNLVISFVNTPGSAYAISPSSIFTLFTNVTVSGYVTTRTVAPGDGMGNSYSEYYIEDTNGYGAEVFIANANNTNQPPLGANITASGTLELYHSQMELSLSGLNKVVTNTTAPAVAIGPILANSEFNTLAETSGTNATVILTGESLVTFTNVYIYGSPQGDPIGGSTAAWPHDGINGVFTNNYTTLFFTVGSPYNATPGPSFNTNTMEIYEFCYNYPYTGNGTVVQYCSFNNQPVPTHCSQITGVYVPYVSSSSFGPEIIPSVLSDYVVSPPPAPVTSVSASNHIPTITWTPQVGSTYSVYGSTNLLGPWSQVATGLAYYPTNGAFTDTTKAPAKFYQVTSP